MRRTIVLLILITAAGLSLRSAAAWHHVRVDYDEGRYLDNAVHVLNGDGFLTSTLSLYFGDPPRPPRPEDFSSPLYPYLLAALFAVTGVSFTAARIASVALSAASIPLVFVLGRKLFGAGAGLVAAAALALQPDQTIVGGWAMTESLYMLLVLIALLGASALITSRENPPSILRAVGLGVLCGALYLIRQNGAAPAAAIVGLLGFGPSAPGERRARRLLLAGALGAAALAVCLPWFARNLSVFGSPAYSRMKNVAWAESGRTLYTPGEPSPSMARFIEEQGTAGLVRNVLHRAGRVGSTLLVAEEGPFRWLSVLALLAPLVSSLRAGSSVTLPPVLLSAMMFLGVAPWSGALPRYFLPLRPLLYATGAGVLLAGGSALLRSPRFSILRSERVRRMLIAAAVAATIVWGLAVMEPVLRDYLGADQEAPRRAALDASAWIALNTEPDDVILEGGLLHQYAYLFQRGVVWIPYGDAAALLGVADRYRAAYLAVTPEALRFRPDLARNWTVEGRALRPLDVPGPLRPVYDRRDEGILIYEIRRGPRSGDLE